MEEGDEQPEDGFASLIRLCEPSPSPSQEAKLRSCPFARESEAFPESNPDPNTQASWSSQTWTASQPTGIVMVSPPDSDSMNERSSPLDDDHFHTPPENPRSHASDSDDPRAPPPAKLPQPSSTTACSGGNKTMVVGYSETERTVDLGKDGEDEGEKLGFRMEGCDEDMGAGQCNCVIRDHGMEAVECEFDGNNGLKVKHASKKIRVSEVDLDLGLQGMDTVSSEETQQVENLETEVIDLDSEECGKEVRLNKERVIVNLDTVEKESQEGDLIRKDGNFPENGVEGGGVGMGDKVSVDGEKCDRNIYGGRFPKNGEEDGGVNEGKFLIGNGCGVCELEDLQFTGNEKLNGKSEKLCEIGDEDCGFTRGQNMCENGEGSGCTKVREYINGNGRRQSGIDKGGGLCRGVELKDNSRKRGNGSGVVCEDENSGGNCKRKSQKSIEEIDKYKYVSSDYVRGQKVKNRGVSGKRELPSSMTGEGAWSRVEYGSVRMKGGFLMDLLDASKMLIRDVDDDGGDDFLETAKRRGMVFPRPKWWPPGGVE